jgi:hypothetical protein
MGTNDKKSKGTVENRWALEVTSEYEGEELRIRETGSHTKDNREGKQLGIGQGMSRQDLK